MVSDQYHGDKGILCVLYKRCLKYACGLLMQGAFEIFFIAPLGGGGGGNDHLYG